MAFPILANNKPLFPNTGEYRFKESFVEEVPMFKKGGCITLSSGKKVMQKGGDVEEDEVDYSDITFRMQEMENRFTEAFGPSKKQVEDVEDEEEDDDDTYNVPNSNQKFKISDVKVDPSLENRIKFAKNLYKNIGLTDVQSASIIGNLVQESNLKPLDYGDRDSKGVAQWRTDRFNGLVKWAVDNKRNPSDLETQLLYVVEEAKNRKSKFNNKLTDLDIAGIGDIQTATLNFGRSYERPSEQHANWAKRISMANKTLKV
jgi:hypothetical protein